MVNSFWRICRFWEEPNLWDVVEIFSSHFHCQSHSITEASADPGVPRSHHICDWHTHTSCCVHPHNKQYAVSNCNGNPSIWHAFVLIFFFKLLCYLIVYYMKYYNAYLHILKYYISCILFMLLLYHFYYISSEYFLLLTGTPRWLTCISNICTRVLAHMVLSIGDMRRNGIQRHAPRDDPFLSSFIVLLN